MTDELIVRADGMTIVGALAQSVYFATDWTTRAPMRDIIVELSTNPNYGPGQHPFWVKWDNGLCKLYPAMLEGDEQPDLILRFPEVAMKK